MEIAGVIICFLVMFFLAVPLGIYISRIMNNEEFFFSKVIQPLEMGVYKAIGINPKKQMKFKEYLFSILGLSGAGILVLFIILLCQGVPILNPQKFKGLPWHLALSMAISFVTNTNWQPYSGEAELSYLSQSLGLTVQNFISPAVGISVLFAFLRSFTKEKEEKLGNFWVDITRAILYIFIPLSLFFSVLLVSQGVMQNFNSYIEVPLLENIFPGGGTNITSQIIPQGPVASQVAIKQLGTNGGGFFRANSASPFENPTEFSNILEMIAMGLIPISLCFAFGRAVKNKKQGIIIFASMLFMFLISLFTVVISEKNATPKLLQNGEVDISFENQVGGNMEGKESRIGTAYSAVWSAFSAATANGATNSNINSYTPLGGLGTMILVQAKVVFGGIGSGLYGMLAFIILAVFIIGLIIGEEPEYLNKKLGPFEIKMAAIVCLAPPFITLFGSAVACALPGTIDSLFNIGPHGFSEVLYSFSSIAANNGFSFLEFKENTIILNLFAAVLMLLARFIPIAAVLAIAGKLSCKEKSESSAEILKINSFWFAAVLITVICLVVIISFLPALLLGPIAEFLQMFS